MLISPRDFKVTVPALLFAPDFFVFDFVAQSQLTKFLVVDENLLGLSPFVDIHFEPLAQAQFWVSNKELFALEGRHDVQRPQPVYIFHHAFACSTLLARCLNQIDAFFSLKEPWILRRLADYKRANSHIGSSSQWREIFCKYVMLLCRTYRTGKVPVIKVTNVANNLLPDVLRFMPQQKILYLYTGLESFLISNLKKTSDTQQKIPGLAQGFLQDGDFGQRFPLVGDVPHLSFLQVCSMLWLVNLYNFKNAVEQHGSSRVKTLDAKVLLDDLPATLGSLSRFFGHVPDAVEVQRMTDPQIVQTNAKDQSLPYGRVQRQLETTQVRNHFARELESAKAWIEPLVEELGVLEFMHNRHL